MANNHHWGHDQREAASESQIRGRAGGLPVQNLLAAAVVIGGVSGGAAFLNTQTGLPFGPVRFTAPAESSATVVWSTGLAVADVIAMLAARGVARQLLLPRRLCEQYGYWLLAWNTLLGTLPLVALDLLATQGLHWWHWESSTWQWQGIALPLFAGWLVVNSVALLLATPALIDKRPVPALPGGLPLAVWFGLSVASLAACVSRASDAAVAVLVAPVLVVTVLAFQQHRRTVVDCSAPSSRE